MNDTLFALLVSKEYGQDDDRNAVKDFEIGQRFVVERLEMGQSHTYILINDGQLFNAVNFEFEDTNGEVDIFSDPRYNPYLNYWR